MRMRQFQAALCLALELIQQRTILDHQVGEKFQRHIALQFFVVCQPHNPHSASPEHLDQLVATKHDLSAGSVERRLEKATGATPFRGVGRDFGSALLANSDYRDHFGSRSRAPLFLLRQILPEVAPDKTPKSIKSDSPSYRPC